MGGAHQNPSQIEDQFEIATRLNRKSLSKLEVIQLSEGRFILGRGGEKSLRVRALEKEKRKSQE